MLCGLVSVFSLKKSFSCTAIPLSPRFPALSFAPDPEVLSDVLPAESFWTSQFGEPSCRFCKTPLQSPPRHHNQFPAQGLYTLRDSSRSIHCIFPCWRVSLSRNDRQDSLPMRQASDSIRAVPPGRRWLLSHHCQRPALRPSILTPGSPD